jgi:HAD superfamily phosphatase (TIGR01668 family)
MSGHRQRLWPDYRCETVADIDADWLRSLGIRGVLVDADDTLVPGDDSPIAAAAVAWVADLQRVGITVAILSNGTPARIQALGRELAVTAFTLSGKPFPWAFRRALAAIDCAPHESVMVGDQLFTDILGARWAGLHTVLVTPLTRGRHAHTRAIRRLEGWVLAQDRRAGTQRS